MVFGNLIFRIGKRYLLECRSEIEIEIEIASLDKVTEAGNQGQKGRGQIEDVCGCCVASAFIIVWLCFRRLFSIFVDYY
jgi:hypothetical protein